ncbi:MAG TPA: serine hydrolase domain-containing protein, partial [Vicinamibacterales bacterium]|nr:serine hydrolase domain-containing protein [Vicinamibacterales bacterium]
MSSERLQRIHEAVAKHIDAKDVSGAVALVARRGKIVFFEAQGLADIDGRKPMMKDSIFRLASMSKPITSVAVMMMLEEGKVRLTDRVSQFIPEFRNMKVAVAKGTTDRPVQMPAFGRGGPPAAAPEFDLVPAAREITVKDLLTHTSGLMSAGVSGSEQARLAPRGPTDTLASYIPKLAQTPLDFQPGAKWAYSGLYGFDVLARIVEIASGQTYDQFLQQRLFTPLGMKDTGFAPTPERMARVATVYQRTREGSLAPAPNANQLISGTYFSASGGLMSTAEDYLQFAQMLVNGGSLNGRRYLSPKTVELMTSNHTGDMVNGQFGRPAKGMGFGLGVQIWLDPVAADRRVSAGAFGWEGAYGTHQVMDPAEKMVEIIMMQGANGPLQ